MKVILVINLTEINYYRRANKNLTFVGFFVCRMIVRFGQLLNRIIKYEWDNKKPTAQMLGRWQPWHGGHQALFEEILKKTGQVNIMVRDVKGVDDNPFDFETVKKNIEEALKNFQKRIKISLVPNITNICYGRGVGYKIEQINLSKEIQEISATKIRAKMREEGKLK